MTLKPADNFYAALQAAGLPAVPREFAVVPQHQIIPSNTMGEICEFIRVFDEVTARAAWQAAALREAPPIAQLRRNEVCFFSALDFHLAPTGEWRLIEFNDNGSGFIFAALINALYYEAAGLEQEKRIAAPDQVAGFTGIRARLAAARPVGFSPARWLAADICVYLAFKDRYQSPFCRLRRRRGHCRPRRASPSVSKAISLSSPAPIPPSTAFPAVRQQRQFQLQR